MLNKPSEQDLKDYERKLSEYKNLWEGQVKAQQKPSEEKVTEKNIHVPKTGQNETSKDQKLKKNSDTPEKPSDDVPKRKTDVRADIPHTSKTNSIKKPELEMVLVAGGTFKMGATRDQKMSRKDKSLSRSEPVHKVKLDNFYMSKYLVTEEQWFAVMGTMPSSNQRHGYPVTNVSWYDCIDFCNALSELEGLQKSYIFEAETITCDLNANGYRLATEAEWEYAARGGKSSKKTLFSGSDDMDKTGWFKENSGNSIHLVGEKTPNELGIYDLSGNIWELCWDEEKSYEEWMQVNPIKVIHATNSGNMVARGGCFQNEKSNCRIASRYEYGLFRSHKRYDRGFRVVKSDTNVSRNPSLYVDKPLFYWSLGHLLGVIILTILGIFNLFVLLTVPPQDVLYGISGLSTLFMIPLIQVSNFPKLIKLDLSYVILYFINLFVLTVRLI